MFLVSTFFRSIFNYRFTALIVLVALIVTALPRVMVPLAASLTRATDRLGFTATTTSSLPIRFEQNVGQMSGEALFVAHGSGMQVAIGPTHTEYLFENAAPVRVALIGGNAQATVTGQGTKGKTNYLIGAHTSWLQDIATFNAVRITQAYKGIDVVYYGGAQGFEYDFEVAPGVDPSVIHLAGSASATLDAFGNLVIGALTQHAPVAYQTTAAGRVTVPVQFLVNGNEYGFSVGDYDRSLPLTIDPVVRYATYLGGSNADTAHDVAVDSDGNSYITGRTLSSDFAGAGTITPALPGTQLLAFVSKFAPDGEHLWSTYLGGTMDATGGGSGNDIPLGIAVDDTTRQVVVRGHTTSIDFPTTGGAFQPACDCAGPFSYTDIFVVKLLSNGSGLVWGTYYGGSGAENGGGVQLDASGNVYFTGATASPDLPVTAGAYQIVQSGPTVGGLNNPTDAFAAKLSSNGASLMYGTYVGTADNDVGINGGIDTDGNAYLVGSSADKNWVAKLNTAGSALSYSVLLGRGTTQDIAVDPTGIANVAGVSKADDLPLTPSAFQTTLAGEVDAFIVRLDSSGNVLFGSYLGGTRSDEATGVALDTESNVYVTGTTHSTDFPLKNETNLGLQDLNLLEQSDVFLTKLDVSGEFIEYSTYFGGTAFEVGHAIAIDRSGNATLVGETASTNFPVSANAAYPNPLGPPESDESNDVFIVRLTATTVAYVDPGETLTINVLPYLPGEAGLTAVVENNTVGSSRLEVTLERLGTAPEDPVLEAGGEYVDLKVIGADTADRVTSTQYYPTGVRGATETLLGLQHFIGGRWVSVLSSGGVLPTKNTTDNRNGTNSGGTFVAVFDNTSTPKVTELTGTVFSPTLTPADAVIALKTMANDLTGLSSFQRLLLRSQLNATAFFIEHDRPDRAVFALTLFQGMVNRFVDRDLLTIDAATPLLSLAQSTINFLSQIIIM